MCHQTVGLVARHLEANGLPTVIMGAAKDIIEHCGVPRFLFSDFPLGNSAGKPFDVESQRATLELALRLLESAPAPRTTVQLSQLAFSTSAATRDVTVCEYVPRLPTPVWMWILPSGVMRTSPSKPLPPAVWNAVPTPTARTFEPLRSPFLAWRAAQSNCSAPRSSASFR